MENITRREFFKLSAKLAAVMGLSASNIPQIASALGDMGKGAVPVLWLQALSCSGCSVSLLNSEYPSPEQIITGYISLVFHQTLSAATGETAIEVINRTIQESSYYLVVEGSIPAGMEEACMFGKEPVTRQIIRAAKAAKAILAVGSCSSFGGIPSAENNLTGAISLPLFLKNENISTPVIRLPGCPAHPDWIVGTLVHVLKFGMPELDDKLRPKMFYKRLVHDQCPRFADYEREKFAKTFSDEGCLFKLGCMGPNTHADCTIRYWNSRINTCILAGSPCIGCADENFCLKSDFPFYRKNEKNIKKETQS